MISLHLNSLDAVRFLVLCCAALTAMLTSACTRKLDVHVFNDFGQCVSIESHGISHTVGTSQWCIVRHPESGRQMVLVAEALTNAYSIGYLDPDYARRGYLRCDIYLMIGSNGLVYAVRQPDSPTEAYSSPQPSGFPLTPTIVCQPEVGR